MQDVHVGSLRERCRCIEWIKRILDTFLSIIEVKYE